VCQAESKHLPVQTEAQYLSCLAMEVQMESIREQSLHHPPGQIVGERGIAFSFRAEVVAVGRRPTRK
jgi:hypothetical protein